MNAIERTIERLEGGWCTGYLRDGDKFCAVGGLAAEIGAVIGDRQVGLDSVPFYELVRNSPEGKAVAQAIIDHADVSDGDRLYFQSCFNLGQYEDVIYTFNDAQRSVEPVLEMFRYGNKIYSESLHD